MISKVVIQIPRVAWTDIQTVLAFPLDKLESVVRCVVTSPPMPDVEDLAESCARESGAAPAEVEAVLSVAINLSSLKRGMGAQSEGLLSLFADTLERDEFPDWRAGRSAAFEERRPLLAQLLIGDGTVEVMTKARELLYEFQCVYLEGTVLTDVRFIYDAAATSAKGGLVLHTLSLQYREGNETRQLHVTLGPHDIRELSEQFERAKNKADVAQQMLVKQGIPELSPKRSNE